MRSLPLSKEFTAKYAAAPLLVSDVQDHTTVHLSRPSPVAIPRNPVQDVVKDCLTDVQEPRGMGNKEDSADCDCGVDGGSQSGSTAALETAAGDCGTSNGAATSMPCTTQELGCSVLSSNPPIVQW